MTQTVHTPGSLKISRVTLPRFELEYRESDLALSHARQLQKDKGLVLDEKFQAAVGQEVVIDFLVRDRPLRATLLFRLVQVSGTAHILEWWSRRSTDPEILEIWIAGLEGEEEQKSIGDKNEDKTGGREKDQGMVSPHAFPEEYAFAEAHASHFEEKKKPKLSQAQRDEILSLCRRLMLHNPFAALGIHWTAIESEQQDAADRAKKALEKAETRCAGDSKMLSFIEKAKNGIHQTLSQLKTVEKRSTIRRRFVTREQLESSLALARHQLEMAKFRGETHEVNRLTVLIEELSGSLR